MKKSMSGFTLFELVIVIMVLGILMTITASIWSNVVVSSHDKAREGDTQNWVAAFESYKSRFVAYPVLPSADGPIGDITLCLGPFSSFNSKCGQYGSGTTSRYVAAAGSATMLTTVAKIGSVPVNSGPAINNALVGPIVYMTQTTVSGTITVTAKFINFFETNCPVNFTNISSSLPASLSGVLTGMSSNIKACAVVKTLSFTPN